MVPDATLHLKPPTPDYRRSSEFDGVDERFGDTATAFFGLTDPI